MSSTGSASFESHVAATAADGEWEVFMCYRGLRELSGQFYHRLPTPIKNQLRDAGLCHYMAVVRSPSGQLIQFDFGPRGKDVEWRPAGNNSSTATGYNSLGGAGAVSTPDLLLNAVGNVGCARGGCSCESCGGAMEEGSAIARRLGTIQGIANTALLQRNGGNCSGMASLTLQQMEVAGCETPVANGEIREEILHELPPSAMRIGSTRMSVADMRAFYSSLDYNYHLNHNDCRHFVDSFVHHTTGIDRASARFIRANIEDRLRNPVVLLLQRALEKDNTYRVFTAVHAAFTSLSTALLLRVGIRSGRVHQRVARVLHSSAMALLRRAMPSAAVTSAALAPVSVISAAMAAGAVATAAAVTAAGLRVKTMATMQLKQLVGFPQRHWQKQQQQLQSPQPRLCAPPASSVAQGQQSQVLAASSVQAGHQTTPPLQQKTHDSLLNTPSAATTTITTKCTSVGTGAQGFQQLPLQQKVNAAKWPSAAKKGGRKLNSDGLRAKTTRKLSSTPAKTVARKSRSEMVSVGSAKGLPAVVAHFTPFSALVVAKANALGNGLKACLASRPLLSCDDALQLAA